MINRDRCRGVTLIKTMIRETLDCSKSPGATIHYTDIRATKDLGLQGSGLKNAGLQGSRAPGRKIRALGLHCFNPGLRLAKNSIFVRAPSRDRLWAPGSTTKISGLQGSNDAPPPPTPLGPCDMPCTISGLTKALNNYLFLLNCILPF